MIFTIYNKSNTKLWEYSLDKIAKRLHELDTYFNDPDPELVKESREALSTLFQIASGQLPITFALLYLKFDNPFRPHLSSIIKRTSYRLLTNGKDSVTIRISKLEKDPV